MSTYRDQALKVADVVDHRSNLLAGATFERCELQGPAVLLPLQNYVFSVCDFSEDAFWAVPRGSRVEGVIGVDNCRFERCTFPGIGILGTPEDLGISIKNT
jgi:hypothetical protein